MQEHDADVLAYLDRWSAPPNARVSVFVSSSDQILQASLERLSAPGREPQAAASLGEFPGRSQSIEPGSYMVVNGDPLLAALRSFSVQMWIRPELPSAGREQALIALGDPGEGRGFRLSITTEGRLRLAIGGPSGGASVELHEPLPANRWLRTTATFDAATRTATLELRRNDDQSDTRVISTVGRDVDLAPGSDRSLTVAACRTFHLPNRPITTSHFDGSVESPLVAAGVLESDALQRDSKVQGSDVYRVRPDGAWLGRWEFGAKLNRFDVENTAGPALAGRLVNAPMRGVRGHRWTWHSGTSGARSLDAVAFHSDDLADVGWAEDLSFQVPADLESGAYAVSISSGADRVAILPLFVTRLGPRSAQVTVLIPTFTYLAYANHRRSGMQGPDDALLGLNLERPPSLTSQLLDRHPELGSSLYNRHPGGSGICHSSRRRPVLTMDPDYRWWGTGSQRHLPVDLRLLTWLDAQGIDYDVLTDEELHHQGPEALSGYRLVITGSHPEYASAQMLESLQAHLRGAGKLMYLGGNGFYWVTTVHPHAPDLIEVRRGWAGTRDWESSIGEDRHATTGEVGGLWRHRGVPPQSWLGVGFAAMGWADPTGFRRLHDSYRSPYAELFEGVGDEFGLFPSAQEPLLRGCVVDEFDRWDASLAGALDVTRLATSQGLHRGAHQRAIEDIMQHHPHHGTPFDPDLRADMVVAEHPGGGQVFAVGTMNWIPCLPMAGGQANDVSTITRNVIQWFLGD